MEIVVVVLVVAAVAVGAFVLGRFGAGGVRRGPGRRAGARGLPSRRRGHAGGADPMAAVVADHSCATEPAEVEAQEARLRAQANRVAAAAHRREAQSAGSGYAGDPRVAARQDPASAQPGDVHAADGAPGDQRDLQARAHIDAAATHEQKAARLNGHPPAGSV